MLNLQNMHPLRRPRLLRLHPRALPRRKLGRATPHRAHRRRNQPHDNLQRHHAAAPAPATALPHALLLRLEQQEHLRWAWDGGLERTKEEGDEGWEWERGELYDFWG